MTWTLRVVAVASVMQRSCVMQRAETESAPKRQTTHAIDFAVMAIFLCPFSAQKSHVKPPNGLTYCLATTSAWHVS